MSFTLRSAAWAILLPAVLALFGMHPSIATAQGGDSNREAFEQLRERFENGEIFAAAFTHSYVDSFTGDSTSDSGRIWVGRQRYKVQTGNETVVVDGETSRVYDRNRNRVIISTYEPEDDDFAPSRILNGVDSTFTVETQERRGNREYILLTSGDPFAMYRQVEIWLTPDLIPLRIRAVDPADNVITTAFSDGAFARPDSALFRLDPPDGAEVIDMRN
ncbi:MAG: outer membrane lipoprotein carrier protein LolA [Balneolaceae bacterium]|nr:outer membrane lipoprotein carrier protein LolA [Balneolaceae bacterium]